MMCVTPCCCVRVCVGLSSYDSVCAPLTGSLWVTGRSGVCIPVMYALVYQLCACLSVSPCGARVCLWLGVSSWVSKGPPDPGLSSGVCGVCGHRKHLRGAWARYTRGPGSAVCCAGGRSLLCCISCHTHTHTHSPPRTRARAHTHTHTRPLPSEESLLGSLSTGCFFQCENEVEKRGVEVCRGLLLIHIT